jgi:hypothetical protein
MGDLLVKFEMLSESGKTDLLKYLENLLQKQLKAGKKSSFDAKIETDIRAGKLDSMAEKAVKDFQSGKYKAL